jgi:hypothetical protein
MKEYSVKLDSPLNLDKYDPDETGLQEDRSRLRKNQGDDGRIDWTAW